MFARIDAATRPPRTIHYFGLPPDMTEGQDTRKPMRLADVVMIYENPPLPTDEMSQRILARLREGAVNSERDSESRGWLLVRYTLDGTFAGDTWHETIDDAKNQAAFEYGDAVGDWQEAHLPPADMPALVIDRLANAG